MPTDVIKSIGTGGDYSTIQAWEDASPADLVVADQRWIGELKNQTFTAGVTISGSTTDSTRYKYLRCAAGASFRDNANVRTNALRYNTANGAAIETSGTALTVGESFFHMEGVQLYRTAYSGDGVLVRSAAASCDFHQCIFKGSQENAAWDEAATKFRNCLWENPGTQRGLRGQFEMYGCMVVSTVGGTYGVSSSYSNLLLKNTAVFGYATGAVQNATRAGSDYNATDAASISTGTHNVTSLTFSAQVVSTTNDFRAASSGSGLVAGTPDATNTPADISGTTRDATTPTIGAWELAGGSPPPPVPNRMVNVNQAVMTAVY